MPCFRAALFCSAALSVLSLASACTSSSKAAAPAAHAAHPLADKQAPVEPAAKTAEKAPAKLAPTKDQLAKSGMSVVEATTKDGVHILVGSAGDKRKGPLRLVAESRGTLLADQTFTKWPGFDGPNLQNFFCDPDEQELEVGAQAQPDGLLLVTLTCSGGEDIVSSEQAVAVFRAQPSWDKLTKLDHLWSGPGSTTWSNDALGCGHGTKATFALRKTGELWVHRAPYANNPDKNPGADCAAKPGPPSDKRLAP